MDGSLLNSCLARRPLQIKTTSHMAVSRATSAGERERGTAAAVGFFGPRRQQQLVRNHSTQQVCIATGRVGAIVGAVARGGGGKGSRMWVGCGCCCLSDVVIVGRLTTVGVTSVFSSTSLVEETITHLHAIAGRPINHRLILPPLQHPAIASKVGTKQCARRRVGRG